MQSSPLSSSEMFLSPQQTQDLFKQSLPVSSSVQALTTTTLLSVSVDLSLLNNSRNGITLLFVMGFCQHIFESHPHSSTSFLFMTYYSAVWMNFMFLFW